MYGSQAIADRNLYSLLFFSSRSCAGAKPSQVQGRHCVGRNVARAGLISCPAPPAAIHHPSPGGGSTSAINAAVGNASYQAGYALGTAFMNWLLSPDTNAEAAQKQQQLQKQQMMEEIQRRQQEAERQHQAEEARRLAEMYNRLASTLKLSGLPQLQLKTSGSRRWRPALEAWRQRASKYNSRLARIKRFVRPTSLGFVLNKRATAEARRRRPKHPDRNSRRGRRQPEHNGFQQNDSAAVGGHR